MTSTEVTYGALNNKIERRCIETLNLTGISVELDSSTPCAKTASTIAATTTFIISLVQPLNHYYYREQWSAQNERVAVFTSNAQLLSLQKEASNEQGVDKSLKNSTKGEHRLLLDFHYEITTRLLLLSGHILLINIYVKNYQKLIS